MNAPEGTEESIGVSVDDPVLSDLKPEPVILLRGGQNAINEEVSGFEMVGFDGQLLDRVPSGLITSADGNQMSIVLGSSNL